MDFKVLGPIEVWDGERAVDLGPRMARAVLALLVMDADRVVSLDRLIDQLWGDQPPTTATTAVQGYVSQLRRALEPDRPARTPAQVLVTQPPGYLLRAGPAAVDAARFEALVTEGRELLSVGRPAAAGQLLRQAMTLWRGDPYAEFALEPFAAGEVARLEELHEGAAEVLVEADLAGGEHVTAVAELERLVAAEPLRERRWELLVLALYRCGRQAEALRALDEARGTLGEELGIEPGHTLRRLEADVLAQSPTLDWVPPATLPPLVPGATPPRDPAPAPPTPSRTVFGRGEELAQIEEALGRTDGGRGVAILLSGEPGIGKTCLAEELAARAAQRGSTVAWGRAYDGEVTAPLWPWVEVVRAVCSSADPGVVRHAIAPGAGHIAQLVPEVKELVGGVEAPPLQTGEAARFGLYNAVIGLLVRMAAERPLVIVAEDLHWADLPSLQLLELVADHLDRVPLSLVLTYRNLDVDAEHPLTGTLARLARHPVVRVPLTGLAAEDVARLVTSITGTETKPEVAGAVHARTEGNPLFVSELARLLHSEDRLAGPDGAAASGPIDVPTGVRDVIRQRLRRLPEDALALIRAGAVLGAEFDLDVLISAVDVDEDAVFDSVEAGLLTGVLAASSSLPGRYRFSHALVRETLYAELSSVRRVRLHARAATALLEVRGDGGGHVVELAHHFWQARSAGLEDQALVYTERAAEWALGRLAYEHAEEQLARARQLVEQLPPGPERAAHELRLHLVLKKVLSMTRGFATADLGDVAGRARDLARELGDARELVASLWGMWAFRCVRGELDLAAELAGQLLELGEHDDDLAFRLAGHYTSGITAWHRGDQPVARRHLDRAVGLGDTAEGRSLSETLREYIPDVSSRTFSALVMCLLGEEDAASGRIADAIRMSRERDDKYALTCSLLFDAWCAVFQRRPEHALRRSDEAIALATEHGFGLWVALGSILRGWARAVRGEQDGAVAEIQGALVGMEATGARMLRHFALGLEAEAHWRAGRAEEALSTIDDAMAESDATGERFFRAELHRLRGEILAASPGRGPESEAVLHEAVEVARAQHARLLERRALHSLSARRQLDA